MKYKLSLFKTSMAVVLLLLAQKGVCQYYFSGTTLTDSTTPAVHVTMQLHSSKMLYRSGATGDFGIPSRHKTDTVSCWAEGYDTTIQTIYHGRKNLIFLRMSERAQKDAKERGRLASLTPNLRKDSEPYYPNKGETYAVLVENPVLTTNNYPTTGLSPNPNKASYSNLRRFIRNNLEINPNAVRIEELLNYFNLPLALLPDSLDETFSLESHITDCPWNSNAKLMLIHGKTKQLPVAHIPPANLVFLIDNSGSMDMPNRMPLLKSAFTMLVKMLRPQDQVAIVTYGGIAGIWLPPTKGTYKQQIFEALDSLEASGATAGSSGIDLAYKLAAATAIPNGNNRVILATDGDFNVGITAEKELEALITRYARSGIHLTCLGVGMGNYKDSKIETLARYGNGNYAYLDTEQEAEKVLVTELTQNLYNVANQVVMHMHFLPEVIKAYKLVGYENRKGALYAQDSYLMGSELGAGASINAMVEIYAADTMHFSSTKHQNVHAGTLSLMYKKQAPYQGALFEKHHALKTNYVPLSAALPAVQFATAIAWFGQLCRQPQGYDPAELEAIYQLAAKSYDPADIQQTQFLQLLKEAATFFKRYEKPEKKKKKGR